MNIIPQYIYMKNFLSYKEETFYFKDGCYLVSGKNGSGKTTVMKALLYCLTGKTLEGLRGNDVIRDGQKSCLIKFVFTVNEKEKGFLIVKRNPNKIIFKVGNFAINSSSITDKQKEIQDWFGFDFETLTRFFLIGESDKSKFSFLGSDDVNIKKILTKLSKSELIDNAFDYSKEQLLEKENIYLQKKNLYDTKKKNNEEILNDINIQKSKLLSLKNNKVNEKKLLLLIKKVNKYKGEYIKYSNEKNVIEKQINEFELENQKKINKIMTEVHSLDSNINNLTNEIAMISVKIKSIVICNKCKNEINNTGKKVSTWTLEESKLYDRIRVLRKAKIDKEKEALEIKNYKKNIDYISLIKKMNFVEEKEESNKDFYETNKEEYDKIRSDFVSEIKSIKSILISNREKYSKQQEELKVLDEELKVIESKVNLLKKYSFWFGKEGFKNYLFGKKLKLIEYTVNKILEETNSDSRVELSGMTKLKSGRYNQKIKGYIYFGTTKREYKELSKGEARKIDLAFIIAFSRLSSYKNNFNLRMFDEPFGGLDDENLESIIDMLQRTDYMTYVSSPVKQLREYFEEENIIDIKKVNKVSQIIYN